LRGHLSSSSSSSSSIFPFYFIFQKPADVTDDSIGKKKNEWEVLSLSTVRVQVEKGRWPEAPELPITRRDVVVVYSTMQPRRRRNLFFSSFYPYI
jgi:hypothetical protein